MPTVNKLALDTIIRFQADIGPGVSGWNSAAESTSVSTLIGAAMTAIGIVRPPYPETTILAVSNEVIDRLIAEVNPAVADIRDAEARWAQAAGQLQSALVAVESDLQAIVDLEGPEELAASSAGDPPKKPK